MIGVVVPAHNEEEMLPSCIEALLEAARHPALAGEPVTIAVVLDACTDRSQAIAARFPVLSLSVEARNVGAARAAGAGAVISAGARWLAFTDADSVVSPGWLAAQLAREADAVCGTVSVDDWSDHTDAIRSRYDDLYCDADGHRHIHGANLGVASWAYLAAGGFPPLTSHEDVALVAALSTAGARIAWSNAPRVRTSARRVARAPHGFASFLQRLQAEAVP